MASRREHRDDAPLSMRLWQGLGYPARGPALLTCIVLGLCNYVMLLPGLVGLVGALVVWWAAWGYAAECLVVTANGDTEPPEARLDGVQGSARNLFAINVLALLVLVLVAILARGALWPALMITALVLPAIDLSLAFDGDFGPALNPVNWARVVARFGLAYLVPVLVNVVLAGVAALALGGTALLLPTLLAVPVLGFAGTWLLVLEFHWMGLLVWHYQDRLGVHAEAPSMAPDPDDELVRECDALAQAEPEEAAIRLRDRIRERAAPPPVHLLYRKLLRRLDRRDLLLVHAQAWIAQLCANDDARRALGVVNEARALDPAFLPDDADTAAALALLAERIGMRRLARGLAEDCARRWPQHAAAAQLAAVAEPDARP